MYYGRMREPETQKLFAGTAIKALNEYGLFTSLTKDGIETWNGNKRFIVRFVDTLGTLVDRHSVLHVLKVATNLT